MDRIRIGAVRKGAGVEGGTGVLDDTGLPKEGTSSVRTVFHLNRVGASPCGDACCLRSCSSRSSMPSPDAEIVLR